MTDKEKKSKIADILMDFQEEYSNEVINRPMLASLYAGNILSFIDSLQEEPVSEDLEMAALLYYPKMSRISESHGIIPADNESHYLGDANEDKRKAFIVGAQWQKEQDQSTIELAEDHAMLAGMEKMKEQIMTKSIEAVVSQVPCSNEIILYNPSSVDKYYLPQEMNKLGLNKGDKVKVIVIKED